MKRAVAAALAVGWLALLACRPQAAQLTACTAGSTTCQNDTINDIGIYIAVSDVQTQERVWTLWNQQCQNIYSEAASTTGHTHRTAFCLAVAAAGPSPFLVSAIMNSTVSGEVLAGQSVTNQPYAGNMVDADVTTAIGAAMTVTAATASTTATGSSGAATITVASATGIVQGQSVYAAGVPPLTQVAFVSGTTVYLTSALTAALSATPVAFVLLTGLPMRN